MKFEAELSGLNRDLSDEARQWALPSAGGKNSNLKKLG